MREETQDIREKYREIVEALPRAPAPEGEGFPQWTQDGIESMPGLFNETAHIWDSRFGETYRFLHEATAAQIPETEDPITILDVGCGTGLELAYIFDRAPNAQVTGLDQAPRMLSELERKYDDRLDQITLIEASCLDWPAGLSGFDFALSILTVHHFPPETKVGIYASIRSALGEEGRYIEGDQMVKPEIEDRCLKLFEAWIAKLSDGRRGAWNFDIRLTPETNQRLLREAGFANAEKVWDDGMTNHNGHAVLVARA